VSLGVKGLMYSLDTDAFREIFGLWSEGVNQRRNSRTLANKKKKTEMVSS